MKYEKFWEISNSMRAVTINSEFSLPGLISYCCSTTFTVWLGPHPSISRLAVSYRLSHFRDSKLVRVAFAELTLF